MWGFLHFETNPSVTKAPKRNGQLQGVPRTFGSSRVKHEDPAFMEPTQKHAPNQQLGPPVERFEQGYLFSAAYFSRGTLPQKGKRALLGDLAAQKHAPNQSESVCAGAWLGLSFSCSPSSSSCFVFEKPKLRQNCRYLHI